MANKIKKTDFYMKAFLLLLETTFRLVAGVYILTAYSTSFAVLLAVYFIATGVGVIVQQYIKK